MKSKWLILGGSGMLGQAIKLKLIDYGVEVYEASYNSNFNKLDITDKINVKDILLSLKPNYVVNCAALTDLKECESKPKLASVVNGNSVKYISYYCEKINSKFIQISTDAFYNLPEKENHEKSKNLNFPTVYARSKYIGEKQCLSDDLIIRTTFLGRKKNNRSLLDFFVNSIINQTEISIYSDVMTSSLDLETCASTIIDLANLEINGIVNLGTTKSYSKADLFISLLDFFKIKSPYKLMKCKNINEYRGNINQGMNVNKVENYLKRKMPDISKVVENLAKDGYINELRQRI